MDGWMICIEEASVLFRFNKCAVHRQCKCISALNQVWMSEHTGQLKDH
jgi:hypothetical protein